MDRAIYVLKFIIADPSGIYNKKGAVLLWPLGEAVRRLVLVVVVVVVDEAG